MKISDAARSLLSSRFIWISGAGLVDFSTNHTPKNRITCSGSQILSIRRAVSWVAVTTSGPDRFQKRAWRVVHTRRVGLHPRATCRLTSKCYSGMETFKGSGIPTPVTSRSLTRSFTYGCNCPHRPFTRKRLATNESARQLHEPLTAKLFYWNFHPL